MRKGISTGTCAAAAARAAVMLITGGEPSAAVRVELPSKELVTVPVAEQGLEEGRAWAMVRKDAGDDPDVTHGLLIGAGAHFSGEGITITGGRGVGRVTRPGLAVSPGSAAINPVPLAMIRSAVAGLTDRGLAIEIFVPQGERIAVKTFNERLGILGGISILGTSGIVRPFSVDAIRETIFLNINMVFESGRDSLVLVPGRLGFRAAREQGFARDEIVEVSNEWRFALETCLELNFRRLVLAGHPGKLLKFIDGDFQTHSKKSASAVPVFQRLAGECLGRKIHGLNTVEQGILSLDPGERSRAGNYMASLVRDAVLKKTQQQVDIKIMLINLKGEIFGHA